MQAASQDIILSARGLSKQFSGFMAVKDVDLEVRRGTIHALIGPNGAGKTTCFNLLTKFLQPTAGSIDFNGRDITGMAPADIGDQRHGAVVELVEHLGRAPEIERGAALSLQRDAHVLQHREMGEHRRDLE